MQIRNWLSCREQRIINGQFSEQKDVEDVLRGSVLGHALFNLCINDLELRVSRPDAKKLFRVVQTKRDYEELPKDLSKLSEQEAK